MKYQLKEKDQAGNKIGPHRIGNKKYHAGDILQSDMPLDKLFRGKFERVADANARVSQPEIVKLPKLSMRNNAAAEAVVDASGVDAESVHPTTLPVVENPIKEEGNVKSQHGADVTEDFPNAELTGMKVFHDVGKDVFKVVDPGSDEVLKRAKTEAIVEKFLKTQLG